MLKKKLPVGIDNFEKLRKEDFYYMYIYMARQNFHLTSH